MLRGGAVHHVEDHGVGARGGRGPHGLGAVRGGAVDDAPVGPAVPLPDELVLEAGGVAGDVGLELERAANFSIALKRNSAAGPSNHSVGSASGYVSIVILDICQNLILSSTWQNPINRRRRQVLSNHAPVSVSPIGPSPMPNKLIFKPIGLTGDIYPKFYGRPSTSQFFRKGNSINGIRVRKLSNNSSGISLAKTTTAVIGKVVSDIAGIRNKAMLN